MKKKERSVELLMFQFLDITLIKIKHNTVMISTSMIGPLILLNNIHVVFLGILALIIIRTLWKDIARYNKDGEVVRAPLYTC